MVKARESDPIFLAQVLLDGRPFGVGERPIVEQDFREVAPESPVSA